MILIWQLHKATQSSFLGFPALNSQALYPLKERHLHRTVMSGRLGEKQVQSVSKRNISKD